MGATLGGYGWTRKVGATGQRASSNSRSILIAILTHPIRMASSSLSLLRHTVNIHILPTCLSAGLQEMAAPLRPHRLSK